MTMTRDRQGKPPMKASKPKPSPKAKPKRLPKPLLNYGTEFIKERLLPFLNCDGKKPGELIGSIVTVATKWAGVADDFVWRWAGNPVVVSGLQKVREDMRALLFDQMPNPEILKRVNRAMEILSPVASTFMGKLFKASGADSIPPEHRPKWRSLVIDFCPRGSDREFEMTEAGLADFDRVWIPGLRAMLYAVTAQAMEGTALENLKESTAFYYIGCCPRCGKVFKKDRQDQLYDREACRKEVFREKD